MSTKFMNFLAMCWFLSVLINLTIEGGNLGATEATVINDLSILTALKAGGLVGFPTAAIHFSRGVYRLLTWDYSFYQGSWQYIRWFWMITLSSGAVWGILQALSAVSAQLVTGVLRVFNR